MTSERVKSVAKMMARGVARILAVPLYVSYACRAPLFETAAFQASSERLSLWPGLIGSYVRREFYRLTLTECSRDCVISFGTLFATRQVRVGPNVYIGSHCMIGDVDIGPDVLLGSNVHLLSGKAQHGTGDVTHTIRTQASTYTRIRVGADSWIGNGAIVMANIGRKCVVGAGSVVVKDVPDYAVAVGNPARVVRTRTTGAAKPLTEEACTR